jgi:hypothetical protein
MEGEPMAEPRDPFKVDEDRALDALRLAWGDAGYVLTVNDGRWMARHADSGSVLAGSVPDELNRAIRDDWTARNPDPARGYAGTVPASPVQSPGRGHP